MRPLHSGYLTPRLLNGIGRISVRPLLGMLPSLPKPHTLIPYAETLLTAAAGAVASLLGRPAQVPLPLARVCFVLIGILLGAVVTPATLRGMAAWPLSIAILAVSSAVMMIATTAYLRLVHGWEPLSALLAASPGSMAQAIALAAEFGANLRGIAIAQTMRVLLVTIGLPSGLALFGLAASGIPPTPPGLGTSLGELAVLLAASTVSAMLVQWLRFPGGLLFGAMAASAVLHGGDLVHVTLPWWLGSSAVVVLGALVGSRFANTSLTMLLEYFWAALGSAAVAIAVSAVFVLIVVSLSPFRASDVLIAFA